MATKQQLLNQAEIIRKETTPEANSAERVGGLFKSIIQSFPTQIVSPEEKGRPLTMTPHVYDSEVYVDADGRLWTHPQSIIDLDYELASEGEIRDLDTLLTPGKVYQYSVSSGRHPQKRIIKVYLSVYADTLTAAGHVLHNYRMQVKRYFDKEKYITEYRVGEYSGNELNETCEWGEWKNAAPVHTFSNLYAISANSNASNIAGALNGIASYDEFASLIKQGIVFIDQSADGSTRQCIVQSRATDSRIFISYIESVEEISIYLLKWNSESATWGLDSISRPCSKPSVLDMDSGFSLIALNSATPSESIKNAFGLADDTFDSFLDAIRKADFVRDSGAVTGTKCLATILDSYDTLGNLYLTAYLTTEPNTPPKYVYWSFKSDNSGKVKCDSTNL